MKVFIFDANKCNGCHNCQVGCKDEHVGNEWAPFSKPQPNTGHFWMRVKQKEHGQVPMVKVEYTAWPCMHCSNCIAGDACEVDAFIRRDDGLIYIDPDKCNGCMKCLDVCPYKAIFINEEIGIAQKCTGCAHLVDQGDLPHCVDLCATGGLRFGDEEDFAKEIEEAEVMLPESGCSPRVYYVNMPYLFIGGEVWDPEVDEIIEGACITLIQDGMDVEKVMTDDFGDFKFEKLDKGVFDIRIEAEGYQPVVVASVGLQASRYLGDFRLERV